VKKGKKMWNFGCSEKGKVPEKKNQSVLGENKVKIFVAAKS